MKKVIVFDYDGVIADTFPNIFAINQSLHKEFGSGPFPETIEGFREIFKRGFRDFYAAVGIGEEHWKKCAEIFERESPLMEQPVFGGIPEVVKELAGEYRLAVVSASPKALIIETLEKNGLSGYFDIVIARDADTRNSKTIGLEKVKEFFGVEWSDMVALGDRNTDIEIASQHGVPCLLVEYGWGYDAEKFPQTFKIRQPSDIPDAIQRLMRG